MAVDVVVGVIVGVPGVTVGMMVAVPDVVLGVIVEVAGTVVAVAVCICVIDSSKEAWNASPAPVKE